MVKIGQSPWEGRDSRIQTCLDLRPGKGSVITITGTKCASRLGFSMVIRLFPLSGELWKLMLREKSCDEVQCTSEAKKHQFPNEMFVRYHQM
jgi:hypothetical protein